MNRLNELIIGLEANYNSDYWSDNMKVEMGNIIDQLNDKEWTELTKNWANYTPTCISHFADAAMLSDKPRIIPLLIEMLNSNEAQVGASVARTLVEKQYFWDPDVDLVADLKRHLKAASETEAIDIQALLSRLPTK